MNISLLSNAAFGTLTDRIIGTTENTNNTEITGSATFLHLVAANQAFTQGYNRVERSPLTSEIKKLDKARKIAFKSLANYVKSELDSSVAANRQAAIRIDNVLKSEGRISTIANGSMSNRSKIMSKVLNILNSDPIRDDITTINAGLKVNALATVNGEFEAYCSLRANEKAKTNTIPSATTLRGELKEAFDAFVKYVDSLTRVNSAPVWIELNNKIQERIDEALRTYRTKSRTKKDAGKESKK